MKHILLLRHAKSDWEADFGADHERPLNDRGRAAARLIGQFVSTLKEPPELVLTSSAVRARATVELAADAGRWRWPIERRRELYEADPETVLELIRSQPARISSCLLSGHEPTWSGLTGRLIGAARIRFPTAALARIDFRVEKWSEIDFGTGELIWLVTPKLLKRATRS
ncbi:MAG: histidine phosphatase family protein [Acidobacteriota bacterium]|nr:MAG: histidine phosphatase family protein [Acidobacteriota bacterium]